jgi:hypothetical protein
MEADALLFDGDVGVNGALEEFLLDLLEAALDVLTQGVADIEILTGDFDLHGRRKYPCFAPRCTHGRVCLARQLACRSCPKNPAPGQALSLLARAGEAGGT